MEEIVRDYIKSLYAKNTIIKSIDKDIQDLREHREKCLEYLKMCLGNPEVKAFIDQKLVEGDEKFELNKNKGKVEEQELIELFSTCSTSEDYIEQEIKRKNPRGKFIPTKDEYVITKVEKNNSGEYKIAVDNIKGRQYIGAFNWIPDEYYTNWFKID